MKYQTRATNKEPPKRAQKFLACGIRDSKVNEKIQAIIPPVKPIISNL
ncbi:MAG: hypothetical protein Q8P79_01405 [Nanoarchaeota archaeon]|nr:hypothetical protein [Nanoarchaeota archaeon]